jgi:hypothetical protein
LEEKEAMTYKQLRKKVDRMMDALPESGLITTDELEEVAQDLRELAESIDQMAKEADDSDYNDDEESDSEDDE